MAASPRLSVLLFLRLHPSETPSPGTPAAQRLIAGNQPASHASSSRRRARGQSTHHSLLCQPARDSRSSSRSAILLMYILLYYTTRANSRSKEGIQRYRTLSSCTHDSTMQGQFLQAFVEFVFINSNFLKCRFV